LPASVADSTPHGDWEETCNSLHEWAARELDALDTCFVDVENLTERCDEAVRFTQFVFAGRRYIKENEILEDETTGEDICLQWRCIGDEVAVTTTDNTDQYGVPPHELSDLFNRALPPGRTMVYFDMGANGLYVLMETKGMEGRLSKVFSRKCNKVCDPELAVKMDSEAADPARGWPESWDNKWTWASSKSQSMVAWLDALNALNLNAEFFSRSVERLAEEHSFGKTFGPEEGARVHCGQLSVKDAELLASFPGEVLEIQVRGPISDEVATALAGFQGGQLELSGVSDLSEAAIKTLLSPKRSYLAILSSAPSSSPEDKRTIAVDFPLSDACLKKLPAFKSDHLFLKGNANLSDAGAKSLSSFKGEILCLDGTTDLSEAGATALAACRCEQLRLDGLRSLSPAVAAALAKSRCNILHLNGVQSISGSVAEALSAFKGKERFCGTNFELSLGGVATLSDAAAKSLAKTKVWALRLGGLKKLSDVGLSNIAQFDSKLELGFERISDAAAKSLGKVRRNTLHLNALREISDQSIAEIASSIDREFSLNGIRKLSVPAAQVLGSSSWDFLHLDSLATPSIDVAEELAKSKAWLNLNGLTSLGEAEARVLATHQDNIELNGITSLTNRAVEALAKHVGNLGLCGLETLSDTAAAHLAKHEGSLGLSGLKKLSDVAASHLSKHTGPIWPAPPKPINQRIHDFRRARRDL